ncbi:helix-turn-helix domain-containing protein [Streptomyces sp. IB2014 016-6]|uniref:helix-turn-helix domain-containing protein n=1 Tax=Streptomyces sp. IB2014 016-6 TaxID=2517818 RepID=UPI0011C7551D|nr:helix-turn-helix domain-containing protein [Streptomyces sp. IB2014 016-6]TXL91595.1 helix-turn-helix domain-containing protein [Streptomyces sp. IB2014 016-6]
MAKHRPVTDEEREEIRRLHGEGRSRNAIAEHQRRSGRTISKIVAEMGLSFDRASMTAVATEARSMDLAARRLKLAEDLHVDAERMRRQLWQRTVVYSFGGKENTYEQHVFDEAPADVKKSILSAVGIAVDRSLKLAPPKDETGNEEGIALITNLMSGLTAIHRARQEQEATEGA